MKKMFLTFIAVFLFLNLAIAVENNKIIKGGGWAFTKSDIQKYPWSPTLEEAKKKNSFNKLKGWVEYDFEVPEDAWYNLCLGGIGTTNNRDIFIDGKPITVSSYSTFEDYFPEGKGSHYKWMFKECNVFLNKGKHSIRIQNIQFPGNLPTRWELRPEAGNPENMLAAEYKGSPLLKPGSEVKIKVSGGGTKAQNYEVFLQDIYNNTETPVGKIEFPASTKPITKDLSFKLDKEGIYLVRVKADGKLLRPATLKTFPLVVSKEQDKKELPPITPKKLEVMSLFVDNAVLQRDRKVPIWGWAKPGTEVTVDIANQTKKAKADTKGDWRVDLDPVKAGGPYKLKISDGQTNYEAKNIMFGEVWIFAGQSNMGAPMLNITNGKETIKKANFPMVRQVGYHPQRNKQKTCRKLMSAHWSPYIYNEKKGEKSVSKVNGIAYAFCTNLQKELNVPVGAIINNRGGTQITTWTDLDFQKKVPSFAKTIKDFDAKIENFEYEIAASKKAYAEINKWQNKVKKAEEKGDKAPKKPALAKTYQKIFGGRGKGQPARHYSIMIKPIIPYAVRGVCWYQGESDSRHAYRYRDMFPAMIKNWREVFNNPEMPFVYAQIAAAGTKPPGGNPPQYSRFAEQCEAQAMCMKKSPNTMMVCTHDLPVPGDDVHYRDKLPVGERMFKAAMATVYGKDQVPTGPIFKSMEIVDGNKVRIHFDYTGGELKAKGGELKGFLIAGADKKFVWAKAKIEGDTVLVWHEDIKEPKSVRYNWVGAQGFANLYNKIDLPASIFRTDDWPGVTINN